MESTGEKGCLERIKGTYSLLNKAEKKSAQYIMENYREIIHFSITELAERSDTSEATIFRLCNKLKYKGFQDLKISLASEVVKPLENIHGEIEENDDLFIIMHKVLSSNIYSLEQSIKLNGEALMKKAVDYIVKSRQLLFFGMGGSGAIAQDACHKFIRTGINCVVHSDSHYQAMYASMASEQDTIMAFSNSGSNKELIESLEIGKSKGAKIIGITGNGKSPLSKVCDLTLISYGRESLFRSEAAESRLSALMLIDCLYVAVALNKKDKTLNTLENIRKGIAAKRF